MLKDLRGALPIPEHLDHGIVLETGEAVLRVSTDLLVVVLAKHYVELNQRDPRERQRTSSRRRAQLTRGLPLEDSGEEVDAWFGFAQETPLLSEVRRWPDSVAAESAPRTSWNTR